MTAEPRMEDLLASIRKAIHEDIGEVPGPGASQGFKGSMRELRVRVGDEVNSAASEIQGIRDRIQKNQQAGAAARTISPASLPPRPPHNAGFADILSGERVRPTQLSDFGGRDEAPPLRRTYTDADFRVTEPAYENRQQFREEERRYLPPPDPRGHAEPMVSAETANATGHAFGRLAESLLARATNDRSIEEMTRELLRSMLKQWLDDNLPALVERLVREEIERVARRGR